ncbi:MAG: glutamate--tRNA ligase [Planctomycetota bacterium]|nr:glutamate--tRNA ligase [Planctomycetota bacterium]
MTTSTIITRFAPSPTGYLHVGGARTALFNWLLARHTGGQFLLRIEDTDLARSTDQACRQLLDDLRWLGLHWDNPQLVYQSKRLDIYNAIIANLISRNLAYEAWETTQELTALRAQAEKQKRSFIYRRPQYTADQISGFKSENRTSVIRLAMPVKEYRFRDQVLAKEVVLPAEEAQDFVIRKADGMPTYHFAVVVDDAAMNVSHILRGQEHLKNTFNHLALQEALNYPRPTYAHLTTIQNLDGSKMGKRDRDKKIRQRAQVFMNSTKTPIQTLAQKSAIPLDRLQEWLKDEKKQLDLPEQSALIPVVGLRQSDLPEILVHEFRKNGYLPEILLNFIALLGWNPGGDRERMTVDELVQLFSLDRVGVANPKFSRDKLLAFNTEACAAPADRLLPPFRQYLAVNPDSPLNQASDADLIKVMSIKPGFRTLREIDDVSRFFFIPDDQITYASGPVEKVLKKQQGLAALREIRPLLESIPSWTAPTLDAALKQYCEQKQLALGKIAQPIRVAVCGSTISPPIFESLQFLGKPRTLARIDRCLANF